MDWPLSYSIDRAKCVVVVAYHAQPTIDQWIETMERIFADPAYLRSMTIVMDRRDINRPADTAYIKEMVGFIDRCDAEQGPVRWAIVAGNQSSYGMGRMAEMLSESEQSIRTFKRLEEAEEWARSFCIQPPGCPEKLISP